MTRDSGWGTLTGMGLVNFELDVNAMGQEAKVVVDGQDVSRQVSGVVLEAAVGQPTTLTLIQHARSSRITGEGIVQVQADGDMLTQLADVLTSTDAVALEEKALNSVHLGDGPGAVTAECLRLLAEQVRGGP